MTGIGFLGAGVILHSRGHIVGLTTAATIWVVAAIGIAAGSGEYILAIGATALVLVVLIPLRWWEGRHRHPGGSARAPGSARRPAAAGEDPATRSGDAAP